VVVKTAHLVVAAVLVAACSSAQAPTIELPDDTVAGFQQPARADQSETRARVPAAAQGFEGGSAVWIAYPGDADPIYGRDVDMPVIAASLYKLAVMVHIESLIEAHKLKPTDTLPILDEDVTVDGSYYFAGAEVPIDEALEAMITLSDNGTGNAFVRTYGVAINATMERYKIPGLRIGVNGEDHMATARGVGILLGRIAEKRLVSRAASERMLARLGRQEIGGRLDARLPDGAKIAHKTGDLPGLAHDAGVVFTPAGPRVVVVITWDAREDSAHELMARIGQAVYETAR
jgi:beta-lactamase class A